MLNLILLETRFNSSQVSDTDGYRYSKSVSSKKTAMPLIIKAILVLGAFLPTALFLGLKSLLLPWLKFLALKQKDLKTKN